MSSPDETQVDGSGQSGGLADAQAYLTPLLTGWVDMAVYSYDASTMVIAMNEDLTYGHRAALNFGNVSFFSGPMQWTTASSGGPGIRCLSARERMALEHPAAREAEGFIFAIDTDEGHFVLIGASSVELDSTHVYYYPRENLQPGEKLADGLSPS